MESLGKAVRPDSKRKEDGKIDESQPALDSDLPSEADTGTDTEADGYSSSADGGASHTHTRHRISPADPTDFL